VRCTISSVSVAVPDRYLLQLSLPFCIKDEAESVKFSSRKQPSTLTVTLAVEGSIQQQPAQDLPALRLSHGAAAVASVAGQAGHSTCQQQGQQQQQHSKAIYMSSSSSRPAATFPELADRHRDFVEALTVGGPMAGHKS
jgi:hypothetical protein